MRKQVNISNDTQHLFFHFLSFHFLIRSLFVQLKICQVTDMEEQVREFSAKLALVPIPPPGQLYVVGSFRHLNFSKIRELK